VPRGFAGGLCLSTLTPVNCRAGQLKELGFELDDETAEWMRWFNEAKSYRTAQGHSCPGPLTTGTSFVLTNW